MYYFKYILFFMWIYVEEFSVTLGSEFDPEFKSIQLGSSALLIMWKFDPESNSNALYQFSYHEISNGLNSGSHWNRILEANAADTRTKLNDLKENTKYRITVENKHNRNQQYVFEAQTGIVDFIQPTKPDFKYEILKESNFNSRIRIIWLPCGGDDCKIDKTGSHFIVRYKLKDATSFDKHSEYYDYYTDIVDCLPGEVYEFYIASVNNPFETESDIKEIEIPPGIGPVQSFEAVPLGSTAFLLTWTLPLQSEGKLLGYRVFYVEASRPFRFRFPRGRGDLFNLPPNTTEVKLSNLKRSTDYKISVAAKTEMGLGTRRSVDARTLAYAPSQPLKPDFVALKYSPQEIKIQWLPCGKERACHTGVPGSYFAVRFRVKESQEGQVKEEYENNYIIIALKPNQVYEFVVTSFSGQYRAESDPRDVMLN